MRQIAILLFLCTTILARAYGADSSDATVVVLSTDTQRLPVYITPLKNDGSSSPKDYLAQLWNVLSFDLDHNGMMYALKTSPERDKIAGATATDAPLFDADWKALNAFYAIKGKVDGDKLSVRVYAANADQAKSIDGIALTGELGKDRKTMHQIADMIHKALFGVDGIATTKILYTIKAKSGNKWDAEVWESDYDGENRRQLTRDCGFAINPTYVPPRPRYNVGTIFFVSYKTGQSKIYYQSLADGSTPKRLNCLKGNQLMPAISRQRDKIAFISDITGNPDLFVQEFDPEVGGVGKPYQVFSTYLATQGTPTFNPDGNRLAFVSNKDGSPRIYVIDIPKAGTKPQRYQGDTRYKTQHRKYSPLMVP